MADENLVNGPIRIRRRVKTEGGASGAPAKLYNAELAFNENDQVLYIGQGDDGSGVATSVIGIAGPGVVQPKANQLTNKRKFSIIGTDATAPEVDFDGTANVQLDLTLADSGVTAGTYGSKTAIPVITADSKGRVTSLTTTSIATDATFSDGSTDQTFSLDSGKAIFTGDTGLINVSVTKSGNDVKVGLTAGDNVVTTNTDQTITALKTFSATPQSSANQTLTSAENELTKLKLVKAQTVYTDTTDAGSTAAVGGVAKGTKYKDANVVDIIHDILHPYVAPTGVSTTFADAGGVFEQGSSKSLKTATFRWTNGSVMVNKATIKNGGTIIKEQTLSASAASVAVSLDTALTINSNTTITSSISDGKSTINGSSATYTFVYPYYSGVLAGNVTTPTESLVKGLTKDISVKGTKSKTFTTSQSKMCFAYPKSYGALSSVLDAANMAYLSTFIKHTVSITGLDGTAVDYYVYLSADASSTTITLKFAH